ncbi:hypothetical protein MHTCC0001_05660 [Flavobacteriaceae bacterium MHTCC 0001]
MKTFKIVVVVDSIDVNDSSGSKANVFFINNLIELGYNVCVYHYTRKHINLKGVECKSIKELKFNFLYVLSRSQRIIQRKFRVDLSKFLESVFGFSFTFFNDVNSINKALNEINILETDLVLTLSKGASFRPHYAVNKLPEFYNKWIAYVHDPFPFSCYPKPYAWNEPGYKIKKRFFKKVSENAKYSAFPSLLLKEHMAKYFVNFSRTGIVIPHQLNEVKTHENKLPNYFNRSKLTILHAGNLMKQRNPLGLLKGFEKFLEKHPEAREIINLILIGGAKYHEDIINKYSKRLPQLKVVLSSLPFSEVLVLQKETNVNIILEADSDISPFLPGKFPHCVFANKLIFHLGPKKSEVRRLLGEDYQYKAEINDEFKIANVFEKLYNKWIENNNDFKLNRKDLEFYLGKEYLQSQLKVVLNEA